MVKKRFFIGPATWIIFIIVLGTVVLYVYKLIYGIGNLIYILLVLFGGITWLSYIIANSHILIRADQVVFPQQYKMDAKFFLGLTFLYAIFKRREPIKISDIKSADIIVGYNGTLGSLHQPLTLTLKNGTKQVFFMKFYSKKAVMGILKNLKEVNPKINLSKSCRELIDLENPFKMTKTEKKDFRRKRKLIFWVYGILILLILIIVLLKYLFRK